MKLKMLTLAIATMFIVGAFVVMIDANDSEAVEAGSMNIYVYNGEGWVDYTNLSGYNALQALQASEATYTAASHTEGTTSFLSTDYIIQKSNSWGTYDEINSNYGDLLTVNGVTETDTYVWNTYYYDGSSWVVGTDAIGFIVPFTDGAIASANVVLYYGISATEVPVVVTQYMADKTLKDMITPSGDDYEFTFTLSVGEDYEATVSSVNVTYVTSSGQTATKTLTDEDLYEGITIKAYGSNAYSALKNAIGTSNITATNDAGPYYGWLVTLFGLGTVSEGNTYHYWTQMSSGDYLAFNLGAFSTLSNVPTDHLGTTESDYNFIRSSFDLSYS